MTFELRYTEGAEMRVADSGEGQPPVIEGYAALFNVRSAPMKTPFGTFQEIILPGAFDRVLSNDVRALFNHDPNYVIGRTSANTLAMSIDERGLKIRATPPDTQWARDMVTSMRRGDITQMSFSFRVAENGQQWTKETGGELRSVSAIDMLRDVSPVTYPAYPDTSVAVRSLELMRKEEDLKTAEALGHRASDYYLRAVGLK